MGKYILHIELCDGVGKLSKYFCELHSVSDFIVRSTANVWPRTADCETSGTAEDSLDRFLQLRSGVAQMADM